MSEMPIVQLSSLQTRVAFEAQVILKRRDGGRLFFLVPLGAFYSEGEVGVLCGQRRGRWYRMSALDCSSEIRLCCGVAEFVGGNFSDPELNVPAPFSATVLPFESVYSRAVTVFGTELSGNVSMLSRPIEYRYGDSSVTLRETFGFRLGGPRRETTDVHGKMIVSADRGRLVGMVLSATDDYCIGISLASFLGEGKYQIATKEIVSADELAREARDQKLKLDKRPSALELKLESLELVK